MTSTASLGSLQLQAWVRYPNASLSMISFSLQLNRLCMVDSSLQMILGSACELPRVGCDGFSYIPCEAGYAQRLGGT